jgi:hypothetical protein
MKMRNLLLSVIFISFLALPAIAQEVEREMVILEIGTGTWCPYCPGSAMGADDLIENGHDVAVIEYHNGDSYVTTSGTNRLSYYNISNYPTAKFDGVETVAGGSSSNSMYSSYLPYYEARKAIPSAYTIEVTGTQSGFIDYEIEVTMEKVADDDNSNIKLHAAVTESHIEEYWQGMDELNFVERLMAPGSSGTNIDFSDENPQTVTLNFSLDEDWVVENTELVVFLQNNSSKEVLQGKKISLIELPGANACDMALTELYNVPETNCNGIIAPTIEATNFGSDEITSFTVEYEVNGNLYSHEWEGTLATMESVVVDLPEASFEVQSSNTITAEIVQPNNQTDDYENNNTQDASFEEAVTTSTTVELLLRTDNNPEETTWEIMNSAGEVVESGGPYDSPNSWVEMYTEFILPPNDCYEFIVYDEAGNGFDDGNGMAKLTSSDDIEIINVNTVDFGYSIGMQFYGASGVAINDFIRKSSLDVYPNPASNQFNVNLNLARNAQVQMTLFDAYGKTVYNTENKTMAQGENIMNITTSHLESGLYLLRVKVDNHEMKKRVIIK